MNEQKTDPKVLIQAIEFANTFLKGNVLKSDIKEQIPTETEFTRMAIAIEKSLENPDTNDFDTGVSLAAGMLRAGERLPDWLALFAADLLEGKRKRPTQRGKDKYANWPWKYAVWRAVIEVSEKFGLPKYTNNELSDKATAADIVAEAAGVSNDVVINVYKEFGGRIKHEKPPQVR